MSLRIPGIMNPYKDILNTKKRLEKKEPYPNSSGLVSLGM
jgi:hypothetical protein